MPQVDVEALKQEILSLLVSAKGGLTESELLKDYRQFNSNRELPYKDLGYPSLVPLLRSWPDVCRLQPLGNNGFMRILAVEEENTKHILSMVQGQRPGKNRRRGRGGFRSRPVRGRGGGGRLFGDDDNYGAYSSRGTFNGNRNQSSYSGRGSFNGRFNFNNHRMDRSAAQSRPTTGSYNQNSRNESNSFGASRFAKPEPTKPNPPAAMSSSTYSYEKKSAATNSHFPDDRRVTNDVTSLRITVANNNTPNQRTDSVEKIPYDRQYSSDRASRSSETEFREEENDDDDERVDEVLDNLRKLLVKYSHGIRLLSLDQIYQENFSRSLLSELKISNVLLLQDFVDEFATIARHGEENGSSDHIITLKDPEQVAESQAELLRKITSSGPVPSTFRYATNLFSYINDRRFQGHVSDIDKHEHCLHVQPVRYQTHIETLMEELHSYYSSTISNQLIVKNIQTGLSCVTKFEGSYHRVFIKESDLYRCVIVYVDYGTTEEINKDEQEFKYLLQHFAELPCMAIACRLHDLCFSLPGQQWPTETYEELYKLCKDGPFFIEPVDSTDGLLNIRVLDADERCLNDIVLELKLAVPLSVLSHSSSNLLQNHQVQESRPQPVVLNMDFSENAARCPLPDSEPSSPEVDSAPSDGKYPQNGSSDLPCRCKLIEIDARTSFHVIAYGANRPHITCADLSRLLNVSESQIFSETLLSRVRLNPTGEYQSVFDSIQQNNPCDCLHWNQNFLFLFDLHSVVKYMEKFNLANARRLIDVFREQIDASNDPRFWSSAYVRSQIPVQTPNQGDVERYNELLTRRNILCNMLRTNDIAGSSLELESIENELQSLIEKMRLGATSAAISQVSLTPPPGFTLSMKNDQKDHLKDLMQRCKTLINTILILDDYVVIDDHIIDFIQKSLPFLNSGKSSMNEEQLLNHYSVLLQSLTGIVNDLRQRLPLGMNIC